MSIIINEIRLPIEGEEREAVQKAVSLLQNYQTAIKKACIYKCSIDARHKMPCFVYSVKIETCCDKKIIEELKSPNILYKEEEGLVIPKGKEKLLSRPVICGFGPAGIFAGLILAREGYRPLILERGEDTEKRDRDVHSFWNGGPLLKDSNVQFGEGGAGAYSDGKLTTRINDPLCDFVLQTLYEHGAPAEVLTLAKPHIGTDQLKRVIKSIRQEIESLGGEVLFHARLEDLVIKNGELTGLKFSNGELEAQALILAIGHSARDTFEMLYKRGVFLEAKPFAVGVRVEHNRQKIDEALYGKYAGHEKLKSAEYTLKTQGTRACYSFCMCPGGEVILASSEEEMLVVNGMSLHARNEENSNSAIVVNVRPEDFRDSSPLGGILFQRELEHAAFLAGGKNYSAPVQRLEDFLLERKSSAVGSVIPSYKRGYELSDLNPILPKFVAQTIRESFPLFEKKIKGFSDPDAILTGVESRTSSPLRIRRDENHESLLLKGLYPSGEGAGYAGGITSAAVDGIKTALKIMQKYMPVED